MAQPSLKAEFFVTPDAVAIRKAPPLKARERRKVYDRDGGRCQKCGVLVKFGGITSTPFDLIASGQVDHVFPRARGGQNDDANLRLLCLTCNSKKGAK